MTESLFQEPRRRGRQITLAFIAAGCLLLALALGLGLSDNPPAIILAHLGTAVLVLAVAHRWRRARSFLILLAACVAAFFLLVVLHNLFYALASVYHGVPVLRHVLVALELITFLVAVLVCPSGAVIGALGSAVLGIRHLWRRPARGDPA
jgi:hypothetical protein